MKNFKYILLIIFTFLLFNLNVFASENYNSTYNITIPDYDLILDNYNDGNISLTEFIHNFIDNTDFDNAGYNLFITMDSSHMYFYLTPKSYTLNYYSMYGNSTRVMQKYINCVNCSNYSYGYTFNISSFNSDITSNNTSWSNFIYALNNGSIPIQTIDSYGSLYSGGIPSFQVPYYSNDTYYYTSVNNNDDVDVFDLYYYFSSVDLVYNNSWLLEDSSYFFKNLYITNNNTTYNVNDSIPSYYDLNDSPGPTPTYEYVGYSTSLKTFYTNLSPSDVSNYNLKVKFNVPQSYLGFYQTPTEYVYNTTFDYVCSGRVDNTNYYSYDTFSCSLDYSYLLTESSVEYTFYNVSTNQSLSNYDKIYITIKSNYLDSNVSTTIFSYSYLYNLGSFYNTDYKGSIYENFDNLSLNFKVYLSSNNNLNDSNLYVRKYQFLNYNIKYIGFSNITNQQNLVIGNTILGRANTEFLEGEVEESDFLQTNVSNSIDQGIMIYQDNSLIPLPILQLFFNGGVIISINNSTNDFYYIDSNGDITNNTFTKPIITDSSKYDISYYLNQVNDFINNLSNDTLELSLLTQEFYNGMPIIFQTFILVIFILACTYFLFVLIKRW